MRGGKPRPFGDAVRFALAAPFAYALIVPFLMLDMSLWVYQHVCFPAFRIAKVPRGRYFSYDRGRLPYLGGSQRLSCLYCSYANGLIAYAREIGARTEQYFCPIKHLRVPESTHSRYSHFAEHGDAEAFQREKRRLRSALRHPAHEED